jgi:hypothetical protein
MSGIRLGLTLSHLDDLKQLPADIEALEVDYALLLLATAAERKRWLSLRKKFPECEWVFSAPAVYFSQSSEEYQERWTVLNENASRFNVRNLIIRGSVLAQRFPTNLEVHLDLGQVQTKPSDLGFPRVSDPAWESGACSGLLKVHGWHPSRWVRRYGIEAITESVKRIQGGHSGSPNLLILAYSGRFAEWRLWKSVIQLANLDKS